MWEVLWTDYYSNEFVLFVALAVLESHRDVILRYLVEVCPSPLITLTSLTNCYFAQFDEILKVRVSEYLRSCSNLNNFFSIATSSV